ncbi:MAG: DEAD/DEAH box helicase [Proteobacteria bacterium]|jgi:replicative superfamily II helicase|nr:DEAD/DEAH box helicase [Pseudomonadota bacterium]
MPPVIKLSDQNELVNPKDFLYGKFPFDKFNPVQSRIYEIYDKQANVVVASTTASGKTVCAEIIASYEIRKHGGKIAYLAPMKALAKEKTDDWGDADHHFADLKVSICTGDYRLTPQRKKELDEADIIILTPEMMNSRIRNYASEHNEWLKSIKVLILDEAHLLTVPGRGDHLEVGLMKFCEINPDARIVALSATIPNAIQVAEWISYILTGKETYLIESDYRPIPLGVHYTTYEKTRRYESTEEEKVNAALEIVETHPDDKFLIFTHTKRTGQLMKTALEKSGFPVQFHNADLLMEDRHKFENEFKTNKDFQILIATSTLAWGCNTPARRVIIVGVHRGLDEVQPYDIWQMAGRSGRPGYDDRGDCYILLPSEHSECQYHMNRLTKNYKVVSRLLDYVGTPTDPHYKTLAFHLVSEIHHGGIKTKDDVTLWYKRSLANFQTHGLDEKIIESTLNLLLKFGAIKEVDGEYKCTSIGMVSSMFYYSPFDVADLRSNFNTLFATNAEDNDIAMAVALGNVDSIRMGIVSRAEKDEMAVWMNKAKIAEKIFGKQFQDTVWKGAYCYFCLMNGLPLGVFTGTARNLQFDFPRLSTVIQMIDQMSGKWGKQGCLNALQKRMQYGVAAHLVPFCELNNVGKVRAEKLWQAGFRNYNDVSRDVDRVQAILKMSRANIESICNQARLMSMGLK